jgi:general secretion pathway protein A
MYAEFFGFSEKPFEMTPDPKFLYLTPGHREVLATITYGISERRGVVTVVGEAGTGKTMLLNAVLDQLDEKTKVASIFITDVGFDEMLDMAVFELGLAKPEENLPKREQIRRLKEFASQQLAKGGNVVIMVEESQKLSRDAIEELCLLSNLETRKHKLIQIVLCGQPKLDHNLTQPQLQGFAQRVNLRRWLRPLTEKETYGYIEHRMAVANLRDLTLFSRKAQQLIWQYSKGVPRRINNLCDNALLIGYGLEKGRIEEDVIEEAVKDLSWSPYSNAGEDETFKDKEIEPANIPEGGVEEYTGKEFDHALILSPEQE